MIRKNHKKICGVLNCLEQLPILVSTVTRCAFISTVASLIGILVVINSSVVGLKVCVITAEIKKYKLITKKKKNEHDKIVLREKSKQNRIEVLISTASIDSNKNCWCEKKKIKNSNDKYI